MSVIRRSKQSPNDLNIIEKIKQSPGPYVGFVKNSADVLRMGRLDVWIPDLHGPFDTSALSLSAQTVNVRYCSPFAGITPLSETTADNKFSNSQKSYGFWMTPPDIDTQVLVIFANGNLNEGFYIGCISEPYMNYMIPGKASSENFQTEDSKYKSLESASVTEANRRANTKTLINNTTYTQDNTFKDRPLHTLETDTLIKQGLQSDSVRGTTTSSARRETPSQVFGISTPGPIDFDGQQTNPRESINRHGIIYDPSGKSPSKVAHSRLGGHTFVMDDGTPAKRHGSKEVEPITNELIRLRTRSGAQLLLHNTEGLVYITNTDGTAWIEFTKDGKIDIYAKDSVSVRTEADFNFVADRDVNIEAGRNINLTALGTNNDEAGLVNSFPNADTGRISVQGKNIDIFALVNLDQKANSDFRLYANNGLIEVGTDIKTYAGNDFLVNTGNEIHLNTSGKVSSGHVGSNIIEEKTYFTNKGAHRDLSTTKRVPTSEPYAEHENKRRDRTTAQKTDVETYLDEREIT